MKALIYRINNSYIKYLLFVYLVFFAFFDSIQTFLLNIELGRYIFMSDHYLLNVFIQTSQLGHIAIIAFILTFPVIFYLYIFRHICDDYELNFVSSSVVYTGKNKYLNNYLLVIFLTSFFIILGFQLFNLLISYLFFTNGVFTSIQSGDYITNLSKVMVDIIVFTLYISVLNVVFGLMYFLQYNRYITLAITLAYTYLVQLLFKVGNVIQPFNEYNYEYRVKYLLPLFVSHILVITVLYIFIKRREVI